MNKSELLNWLREKHQTREAFLDSFAPDGDPVIVSDST